MEIANKTEEKSYTLRELTSRDVFLMSKILSRIGFKEFKGCLESDEVKKVVASMSGGTDAELSSIGLAVIIEVADIVLHNLSSCEDDIYRFLADLSGMTKEEIAEMSMVTFADMVVDVIQKEEFRGFIKVASRLFK